MTPLVRNITSRKIRQLVVLAVSLLFFFTFSRLHGQTVNPDYVDGVIYFKVKESSTVIPSFENPSAEIAPLIPLYTINAIGPAFHISDASLQRIYKLVFADFSSAGELIGDLENIPWVEYAEQQPLHRVEYIPNDYNASLQWGLAKIQAPGAWSVTTGSATIIVAIVDNGTNYAHQDLAANAWVNSGEIEGNGLDDDLNGFVDDVHGYDVADDDGNPMPPANSNGTPFSHGTHCAGIAAGVTDNGLGLASIGSHIKFMSVKCAHDSTAGGSLTNAYDGVDYAIFNHANVISMSFASPNASSTWSYLVSVANTLGIVLVAAAGNDASNTPVHPASDNYVIAVGATEWNDHKAPYSNYGTWIDVMAPGTSIQSTLPDGGNTYGSLSGTSMACPLVAGLAGLILSVNPTLTPAQVLTLIENGCENIDAINPGYGGLLGVGRINAANSLQVLSIGEVVYQTPPLFLYPNIGDGLFEIDSDRDFHEPVITEVYNPAGQKVLGITLPPLSSTGKTELNLRDQLPDGTYFIRFSDGTGTIQTFQVVIRSPF
jgi:subtilisin family serine protease